MELKTLPLSTEDITKVFVDQEHHIHIDIYNSELLKKGDIQSLTVYLSNMKLKCSFHNHEHLDFKTKSEILTCFIESKSPILCDTLIDAFADVILYRFAGALMETDNKWFTEDQVSEYIEKHTEDLSDVFCFYGSVPLTLLSFSVPMQEQVVTPMVEQGQLEEVTDPLAVKSNALALFTKPDVLDVLSAYALPFMDQKLYTPQIKQTKYEGDTLFNIVTKHGGKLAAMSFVNYLLSGEKEEAGLHQKTVEKLSAAGA